MTIKTKAWPDDDKPASFEDITDPLVNAVWFCYDLTRKNQDKDVPYKGLDIGKHCSHVALNAKSKFTAENIRYSEEEQGRSALTEIIGFAVQLGMEQARRIDAEKYNKDIKILILRAYLAKTDLPESEVESLIDVLFR